MESFVSVWSILLCAAAVAVFPALPAAGAQEPSVEDLLGKIEVRIGAPAPRAKLKNAVGRGLVTAPGMPGKGAPFTWIQAGREAGKIRVTYPGMGEMSFGVNPDYAWSSDPAMGVTIREGEAAASVRRFFAIGRRAPWKQMYERAELAGKAEVGGRPAWKLTMIPAEGDSETWFVDQETFDLLRVDLKFPDPTGGLIPMEWTFEDYRPVAGVLLPFKRVQNVMQMKITYAFEAIEAAESLPAEQILPPNEVIEARNNPAKANRSEAQPAGAFEVQKMEAQPTATIRLTIKDDEVSKTLATVLPEVYGYVQRSGVEMAGPPFSRYHEMKDGKIDLEAGIPVKKPVEGEGRVKPSQLPEGRVATTWHHGPYHELPKTYGKLEAWMDEQKLEKGGGLWEVYWTDPGIEPDPAKWRTQLFWPVK